MAARGYGERRVPMQGSPLFLCYYLSNLMSTEEIWYKDIRGFLTRDNLLYFFPTLEMSFDEKMNAVMRFSLYFTCIMLVVYNSVTPLYFLIFMAALTAALSELNKYDEKKQENYYAQKGWAYSKKNGNCVLPSANNPFMNVLMNEYVESPERPKACDTNDTKVRKVVDSMFDSHVIRDADDIFYKKSSDRQFYTTPNTKIPNDQEDFAKWLYMTEPTCKEGNRVQCYANQSR